MYYLLIDPYREAVEAVEMLDNKQPDPSHPAAGTITRLMASQNTDSQFMPDGDLILFHFDDLLTPSPKGAMVQGCLTFGYALIVPSSFATALKSDAETLSEQVQWIATLEQATAAVKSIHF